MAQFRDNVCTISSPMRMRVFTDMPEVLVPNCKMQPTSNHFIPRSDRNVGISYFQVANMQSVSKLLSTQVPQSILSASTNDFVKIIIFKYCIRLRFFFLTCSALSCHSRTSKQREPLPSLSEQSLTMTCRCRCS